MFQTPGSNALDVSKGVVAVMDTITQRVPPGVKVELIYNIGRFIESAVDGVVDALGLAIVLGMVLATGLVVEDAIVVIEAVSVNLEQGMKPRQAAMVLMAVFVPVAFYPGSIGIIYRQFALTIAFSVGISAFNALPFSSMLSGLILRNRKPEPPRGWPWFFLGGCVSRFAVIIPRAPSFEHHNLYRTIVIQGVQAIGKSSGQAPDKIQQIFKDQDYNNIAYAFTGLSALPLSAGPPSSCCSASACWWCFLCFPPSTRVFSPPSSS